VTAGLLVDGEEGDHVVEEKMGIQGKEVVGKEVL
jgi:hypothetical protein